MQIYIEIALDLNPNFYIRAFFKLILKLKASFDSILKVIKPLDSNPNTNNY